MDRLATDQVDAAIDGLRFLRSHQRSTTKRRAVDDLARYLTTNRDRMQYQTFRAAGYAIGSGAVESAVSHVVQQRMKRVGMRWRAAGADANARLVVNLSDHWRVGPILGDPTGGMNGYRLPPMRLPTGARGGLLGIL